MATAVGLVVVKRMPYRSDPNEEWSNKYWFQGPDPGPSSAWRTLFDSLVTFEKAVYGPHVSVVRGLGYNDNADNAHAVWTVDLTAEAQEVPGTLVGLPADKMSGDQCGMIEWKTDRKNSRGKWVYLRKYFHGGFVDPTDTDNVSTAQFDMYNQFSLAMKSGAWTSPGRILRSQKQDENIQQEFPGLYCTTRTLKRRGKRP